ncbi:MAG: histidine phosphatase family protein [Clostridia bacterium]|nr:histidine phosphatase family protein [Clostridia bacterium]
MELYIVRHGNTPLQGDVQYPIDPRLTDLGVCQAESLAHRLQNVHFDHIFASPLQRCVQTVAPLCAKTETAVQLMYALLEKGTRANYVGLPFFVLQDICPQLKENTFAFCEKGLPPYETDAQVFERAKQVISYVRSVCKEDDTVLLVAHGTFNNFLIHAALGFAIRDNFNFSQDNTGLSLVRFLVDNGKERTKLAFMNDTTHLNTMKE